MSKKVLSVDEVSRLWDEEQQRERQRGAANPKQRTVDKVVGAAAPPSRCRLTRTNTTIATTTQLHRASLERILFGGENELKRRKLVGTDEHDRVQPSAWFGW